MITYLSMMNAKQNVKTRKRPTGKRERVDKSIRIRKERRGGGKEGGKKNGKNKNEEQLKE